MRLLGLGLVWGLLQTSIGTGWAQVGAPAGGDSSATVAAPNPPSWHFTLRPYFFLSGISGSVTAEPATFPINSSFGDLLDNIRIGGFVAFTAEKGRWGVYADVQYISLIGSSDGEEAVFELENVIVEADVTFRPIRAPTVQFLGGLRIYSIDQSLTILGQALPAADTIVYDPILGARGAWSLGDAWDFEMRGDLGGFGVSSEFTYQLMTLFHWHGSRTLSVPFGYRILGYQIKTGDIWMNTQMSGMVMGLEFRF